MQTFQMAILLLFERTNELSGRDIQESIQIPGDQLVKQIQSLIDAKLLKDPGCEVRRFYCRQNGTLKIYIFLYIINKLICFTFSQLLN